MRQGRRLFSQALRLFFELLYTKLSWAYDPVAWLSSIGQWGAWQRTVLDTLPQGELLEIGFGTGHLLRELGRRGQTVIGIDLSRQMTMIARRRLINSQLPVTIARASAFQLPLPASFFAAVLSTFPSAYIYHRETFEEIHRVLKPGGMLVLVPGVQRITGPDSEGKWVLRRLDRLSSWLYDLTGESTGQSEVWQHEVEQQLKKLGFSASFDSVPLDRSVVARIIARKSH